MASPSSTGRTWDSPTAIGTLILAIVMALAGFGGNYAASYAQNAVRDTKYDALYKEVEEMRGDNKRVEAERKASDVLQASRYAADDVFRLNLLQKLNDMSERISRMENVHSR